MPEISFCLFDLSQLLKLFPQRNRELENNICECEKKLQDDMIQIRLNLFSQ